MAKPLSFSRNYPCNHKRKGEPTFFVEKIWKSLQQIGYNNPESYFDSIPNLSKVIDMGIYKDLLPKLHTMRASKRFKAGDWFTPKVWSGRPYFTSPYIIAPDVQVVKTFDFYLSVKDEVLIIDELNCYPYGYDKTIAELASNDGLSVDDFISWFKKPIEGQIICWSEEPKYF